MKYTIPDPDAASVIEVDTRVATCIVPSCGGVVVRHSLGGGQSIDRCTRCFRRYQLRAGVEAAPGKGRLRRIIDDFVSWQDE